MAEQTVQAAINTASNFLPTDLPQAPVYSKVNPADVSIMTLVVTFTAMPLFPLKITADWLLPIVMVRQCLWSVPLISFVFGWNFWGDVFGQLQFQFPSLVP